MKAIRIERTGGPEVLQLQEIATPVPQEGEVLIQVAAAGVNYADIMLRENVYAVKTTLPTTLGGEIAGTIVALGPGASHLSVGTRVTAMARGGYAEYAVAQSSAVIPLPEILDFTRAAAFFLQGVTAYQVLRESARIQPGERVLVHAASGGVGSLAIQLAKLMGAGTVIGTAGSAAKREVVRGLGADVAIDYGAADWVEQVKDATNGQGVDIILEMITGKIGEQSLHCLAPFGRMVVYGRVASEDAHFVSRQLLDGNHSIIGYWLANFARYRPETIARAISDLLQYIINDQLHIIVGQTFPLEKAAEAHRALAERKTTGKVVLLVE